MAKSCFLTQEERWTRYYHCVHMANHPLATWADAEAWASKMAAIYGAARERQRRKR